MPDQHAAATEHELITQIAEPLRNLPDDPLSVVSVDFPVALRGYDRIAVDAYVEHTARLVAELQATRSPEAAVRRALERVGEEISGILQRAHDTADEITARSRAEAEERLELARQEALAITSQAELRVKELDAETERIWAERHSIVTDAHELARRLTELAESALERFPAAPAPPQPPDDELAVPPHLFDGALDAGALDLADPSEPPIVDRPVADPPTVERAAAEHGALEHPAADHSTVDQPTADMSPIEPWAPGPGPLDADEAH